MTETPVAAPVIPPVVLMLRFAGPPFADRSTASPAPAVTLAAPLIATCPLATEIAFTVRDMGVEPSARLPPVPVNSTTKGGEPDSEAVAPLFATRTARV